MRNVIKKIAMGTMAFGLAFTVVQSVAPTPNATAAEKIDGKCSVTINPTKNTSIEKAALGTGKCSKVVRGTYEGGNYLIDGTHSGTATDGEKFTVTIMPGFYTYEVTVNTLGVTKSLNAPSVSSIASTDSKISGTTEPKLKVTVKAGSTTLGSATSDKNGKYSIKLKKKQKAGTTLKVSVKKGSTTKTKTVTVKYVAPTVKSVKSTSTSVKGSTIAKAKVTVKLGSKTLGTATANSKGSYTVKIKKQKIGAKLSVSVKKGSISSKTKTITVK